MSSTAAGMATTMAAASAKMELLGAENHATSELKTSGIPEILYKANPHSIVVGKGPSGLFAAFKLLEQGHHVTIIENRSEFTRRQHIVLSPLVSQILFSMSNLSKKGITLSESSSKSTLALDIPPALDESEWTQNPFYQLFCRQGTPSISSIKDVQIFLDKMILNFYDSLSKEGAKNKLRIIQGSQFRITQLDGDKQSITVRNDQAGSEEIILFDYFIAADGAKHPMANLLKNTQYAIPYNQLPQVRHVNCGSISFKLPDNAKISNTTPKIIVSPLSEKSLLKPEHLKQLKALGWEENYLPLTYIARDENNIFYIIGELPSKMLQNDMKARENWGRTLLAIEFSAYGLASENFIVQTEKEPNPIFKLELEVAEKNVIALGKKGGFFLVGDARQNPNFFYGHGLEDGLSNAETLSFCFSEAACQYKESELKSTLEGIQTTQNLYLPLKIVMEQHKNYQEHYIELHKQFGDLLTLLTPVIPGSKTEPEKEARNIQEAREQIQNHIQKKLDLYLKQYANWRELLDKRGQALESLILKLPNPYKDEKLSLRGKKETLDSLVLRMKALSSEFKSKFDEIKSNFDLKMGCVSILRKMQIETLLVSQDTLKRLLDSYDSEALASTKLARERLTSEQINSRLEQIELEFVANKKKGLDYKIEQSERLISEFDAKKELLQKEFERVLEGPQETEKDKISVTGSELSIG